MALIGDDYIIPYGRADEQEENFFLILMGGRCNQRLY